LKKCFDDLEVKQLIKPFIEARQFQFSVRANDL